MSGKLKVKGNSALPQFAEASLETDAVILLHQSCSPPSSTPFSREPRPSFKAAMISSHS